MRCRAWWVDAEEFRAWGERDLTAEAICYLVQDGWYPKVRIGRRRAVVPVLVTFGVKATGERIIIDLRLAGEESGGSWGEVVGSLVRRRIGAPVLAVIDGNPGPARRPQSAQARHRDPAMHESQVVEP
jgi:transposase-like protein